MMKAAEFSPPSPAELAARRPEPDAAGNAPVIAKKEPEADIVAPPPGRFRATVFDVGDNGFPGRLNLDRLTDQMAATLGVAREQISLTAQLEAGQSLSISPDGRRKIEASQRSVTVTADVPVDFDTVLKVLQAHRPNKTDAEESADRRHSAPTLESLQQQIAALAARVEKILEGRAGGK